MLILVLSEGIYQGQDQAKPRFSDLCDNCCRTLMGPFGIYFLIFEDLIF